MHITVFAVNIGEYRACPVCICLRPCYAVPDDGGVYTVPAAVPAAVAVAIPCG